MEKMLFLIIERLLNLLLTVTRWTHSTGSLLQWTWWNLTLNLSRKSRPGYRDREIIKLLQVDDSYTIVKDKERVPCRMYI